MQISLTEQGQGTEAMIGQIVAESVGVDLAAGRVITGYTEGTLHDGATEACSGAGIGGETSLQTSHKLRSRIIEIAAAILQASPCVLNLRDGQIVDAASGERSMLLGELAGLVYSRSDTVPRDLEADLRVAHHSAAKGYPFAFSYCLQGSLVDYLVPIS